MPSIRVTGFTLPRSDAPLLNPDGTPGSDATDLVAALVDPGNFGPGGVVPCPIEFLPFVNEILPGSLVNPDNTLNAEVFFGARSGISLSPAEASELASFVNAGGILHIAGNSGPNEGPNYNPVFNALGTTDQFSNIVTGINLVQTSVPIPTPVTTGPFGIVGPLTQSLFRAFLPGTGTVGVVIGTGSPNFIIAEGAFNQGYISAAGDPLYFDVFSSDQDNTRYFLNLFALACGKVTHATRGIDISRYVI